MSAEITCNDVRRVVINPPIETSERISRDIVIEMEDGTCLTLELYSRNDSLKVEIN